MPTTQEGGTSLSRLVDCFQAVSEGAVVKSLSSNGEKEHGGTAYSLRGKSSVPGAYLGGVAGYRCSAGAIGAMRS